MASLTYNNNDREKAIQWILDNNPYIFNRDTWKEDINNWIDGCINKFINDTEIRWFESFGMRLTFQRYEPPKFWTMHFHVIPNIGDNPFPYKSTVIHF